MADSSTPSQPSAPPSSQPPPSSQIGSQELPSSSTQATVPGELSGTSEPPVVPKEEPNTTDVEALDASIEQDIDMNPGGITNAAGASDGDNTIGNPVQDAMPTSVDAIAAAVAPYYAVTAHYLTLAGLPPPGNGPNQTPPHLARLLALATQKFIADIAADSYQYARIRASNSTSASNPMGSLNAASGLNMPGGAGAGAAGGAAGVGGGDAGKGKANTHLGIQRPGFGGGGSGGSGQGRTVLTMEDLGMAVAEYGVSVKRGEFYR
ncbi:hypothetical protein KXX69_007421 [Aspergillus fumigatus]|nr:hypothetical protein KXX69_007421 [Aspergillus fumigatus]